MVVARDTLAAATPRRQRRRGFTTAGSGHDGRGLSIFGCSQAGNVRGGNAAESARKAPCSAAVAVQTGRGAEASVGRTVTNGVKGWGNGACSTSTESCYLKPCTGCVCVRLGVIVEGGPNVW
jgi:hypothetical protein